ncbi:hypothetical protein RHMOL_Rhmol06G0133400 [Rhododendron molle]|uniref:Uncharacterized protein n=1 Tax=Rhododendron molle TaxID=49168 RepID=A0ACC0NBS6_RHOML|nr:hypothetical protein RHMOL_Rhmol06G0133400 [Rhododendron molle]
MLMFDFRSLKGLGSLGGVSSCVGEQSFHYCSSCFCCSCCIYSKEHVLNASPDLRIRPFLQVGHDCIEFLLVMPLQRAEDLGGAPVWVFNYGISHNDEVDTSSILPFLQEHWPPWPKRKSKDFFLELEKNFFVWAAYVQGCSDPSLLYEEILDGLEFAKGALDSAWGSVQVAMGHLEPFLRLGMKTVERRITVGFVSEYAVTGNDAGTGSLLAALAEAGGTQMRLFFNSYQLYGTPSFWMQRFFPVQANYSSSSLITSAIAWKILRITRIT